MFKNKIKKKDLVNIISSKTGLSQSFSKKVTDDLLRYININIANNNFIIKNLGTFKILKKKERLGRNPKTMKEYIISARKSVKFTPSQKLIKNLKKHCE